MRSNPPKCFLSNWKKFKRWSTGYNQAVMSMIDLTSGKYPVVNLGSILELVQYGTSEKANINGIGIPVLRIKNIKGGRIDVSELKHVPLGVRTLQGLRLVNGDILIIRTSGSRDLVGTCAVFQEEGEFVFASYLIRLRPSSEKALPDYIAWYINSPLGRQQVDSLSRQIMQNNINSQELRILQVPLPPLEVQKEIMEHVEAGRCEIVQQKGNADLLYRQTGIALEEMILGTRPVEAR
jgi:restriction endonuclease S subunit